MTKRTTKTASTTTVPSATKTAAATTVTKTAATKTAATKTAATKTAATKTAATKTAATKTAATKTAASSGAPAGTKKAPARVVTRTGVKSRLPFTVEHPELQAVAAWRGWNRPGLRLGLSAASLVYTTDRWSTVKTASLEGEEGQGFILTDVPAGTPIEFAVRASLVAAEEQGGAPAGALEFWLNNSGRNYSATTL